MATPEQIRQGIGEGWVVVDTLTLEAYVALATLGSNTPPRAPRLIAMGVRPGRCSRDTKPPPRPPS
jgi:hypothetical protein